MSCDYTFRHPNRTCQALASVDEIFIKKWLNSNALVLPNPTATSSFVIVDGAPDAETSLIVWSWCFSRSFGSIISFGAVQYLELCADAVNIIIVL